MRCVLVLQHPEGCTYPCPVAYPPGRAGSRGPGTYPTTDQEVRVKASLAHALLTVLWIVLILPTLVWWRESVLWIGLMSIWANVVSHATAYEAAKAKELAQDVGNTLIEGEGADVSPASPTACTCICAGQGHDRWASPG